MKDEVDQKPDLSMCVSNDFEDHGDDGERLCTILTDMTKVM